MKKQLHELLVSVYGIIVAVAVLAGALVAVLFFAAFIVNGTTAAGISGFNNEIMNYSKKLACYAIFFGLIDFYLMKDHHLTIDQKEDTEDSQISTGVQA